MSKTPSPTGRSTRATSRSSRWRTAPAYSPAWLRSGRRCARCRTRCSPKEFARQPARHRERVAIADPYPSIDDGCVVRAREEVLTDALDEVRRGEWNRLRRSGGAGAAKALKGLRFLLLRNWENLSGAQKGVIRELEGANRRMFRAWQLKEELRDIFAMGLAAARRALDDWLGYASRSKLAPFVKLARTIRHYRSSIEATIEWKLTNGIAESNNAAIGRLRTNARGFQDPANFITMIMLDRAGICPGLPWQLGGSRGPRAGAASTAA